MDNLLLARLAMGSSGLLSSPLMSELLTSTATARASIPGSGSSSSNASSNQDLLITTLLQEKKCENLAMMQALSDEAKRILAAELAAKAEKVEDKAGATKLVVEDAKTENLEPGKGQKRKADVEMKGAGSVAKFLPKADAAPAKPGDAGKMGPPQTFVQPKPKHRPASLVQCIEVPGGTLEVYTRFRPKQTAQQAAQAGPPEESQGEIRKKDKTDGGENAVSPFPPLPPPPPILPPLPPPTTPHPDLIKEKKKETQETLGW